MTKQEAITEQIAMLLLSSFKDEQMIQEVVTEAEYMALRALRAKVDPTWWKVPGRPHFNKLMARLRMRTGERK